MTEYLVKRLILTVITMLVLSIAIYAIVQIPPGNAVTREIRAREAQGDTVTEAEIQVLRQLYDVDRPFIVRYWDWLMGFLSGHLGRSVSGRLVADLVKERLPQTIGLSLLSLVITYVVAIPMGIYSATNQYAVGDYIITSLGFIGLTVPGFLIGIILLYLFYRWFGISIGGFFSPEFTRAPWSLARLADLLQHLIVPALVIALSGMGGLLRTMRATLLDELGKQYVMTARAKGVPSVQLLLKYPVRIALNPIVAGIGSVFPALLSGQVVLSIVLNLPTLGPLLTTALRTEDIALSTSVLMIQGLLAIFGTAVSDLLLAILDPRIRIQKGI